MKTEKTIEEVFAGLSYILWLHDIGITTFKQLKEQCVGVNKTYKQLSFPKLSLADQVNINWGIAHELAHKKLISEVEVTKQLTLSCYYTILKKKTRRALILNNIRTVGDVCNQCLENGSFKVLKGKKIGPRVNYDLALMLKHVNFLSEKEFLKVPLPSWKTRLLTDREIGRDGIKKLHKMEWSDVAKDIIIRAVSAKFPDPCPDIHGNIRSWKTITLGELVKTFVRIDSSGNAVFYKKGHTSSRWYSSTWFIKKLDEAFPEIEKKLFDLNFVSKIENDP